MAINRKKTQDILIFCKELWTRIFSYLRFFLTRVKTPNPILKYTAAAAVLTGCRNFLSATEGCNTSEKFPFWGYMQMPVVVIWTERLSLTTEPQNRLPETIEKGSFYTRKGDVNSTATQEIHSEHVMVWNTKGQIRTIWKSFKIKKNKQSPSHSQLWHVNFQRH